MTQTHTSERWHVEEGREAYGDTIYAGDRRIAQVDWLTGGASPDEQALEYARFIATAPETAAERDRLLAVNAAMLEALEAVAKDWDNGLIVGKDGNAEYHLGRLGVVLAAATGGTS